jgi:hypothetical protein
MRRGVDNQAKRKLRITLALSSFVVRALSTPTTQAHVQSPYTILYNLDCTKYA